MAYNLAKLKDDIENIVDKKIDELKNGFRKDLLESIDGQIKIQMSAAWDTLSGVVENKITAASIRIQNSVDRFQKDASEKLEYFALILAKMNELSSEVNSIKKQRETCLQNITRLQTQTNGRGKKIEVNEKRINDLEDKPGTNALNAWNKILWIIAGAVIPAVLYGLYRLIEYIK